jgi:low temperature requirement protein LtrA
MPILNRLPVMPVSSEERHAGWLELFFDLVFVLAIAELTHYLRDHLTPGGALGFVGLFVSLWWLWLNFSFFADQFDPDHIIYRLVMLLAMLCSIVLAVNIKDALGEHGTVFILMYATLQALAAALYLWGSRDRRARPLATRFAIGFALATVFWLASLWIAAPLRYIVWTLAMIIGICTPLLTASLLPERPFYVSHLPERLGTFTIIVLGESILQVGTGLVGQHWHLASAVIAVSGFIVAACLWWLYFDRIDMNAMQRSLTEQAGSKRELARAFTWSYTHVVIFSSLGATSVGITLAISEAQGPQLPGTSLVLCLGPAITLLAITLLHQIGPFPLSRLELIVRLVVIALLVLLAFLGVLMGGLLTIILLAFLLIAVTAASTIFILAESRKSEKP